MTIEDIKKKLRIIRNACLPPAPNAELLSLHDEEERSWWSVGRACYENAVEDELTVTIAPEEAEGLHSIGSYAALIQRKLSVTPLVTA